MSKKVTDNRPEGVSPSGLPLLYKLPAALDAVRHSKASIVPSNDFSFAKHTNSLPLNTIEFIHAAKTYPIVFTEGKNPLPVAIVGMEQENYFIKTDNSWEKNAYVPAYIRQYPFIFFENSDDKKFYLCVDEASAHFKSDASEGGNRLYDDAGKVTAFAENALKFCSSFYRHHLITRNFCNDLQELKLLEPYKAEVTVAENKKAKLSGFMMIGEKAFNALPAKDFLSLRDKGWLPFIYFSLASATNWKNLSEARANS